MLPAAVANAVEPPVQVAPVVEPLPVATVSTLTRTGTAPGIGYTASGAYVVTPKVASPPAWFTEGAGLPPSASAPPVYEYIPPPPMQLLHPKWAMVFMTSCVGAILFFCYSSYKQQLRETAEREALLFEKREKEQQAEESGGQYGSTARGDDGVPPSRSSRKAQPAPLASGSASSRRREEERADREERAAASTHSSSRRGSEKSSRRDKDKPSSSSRRDRERDDASAASVEMADYAEAPGGGDQGGDAPKKSLLRRVASKPLGAVYSMFSSKQ